MALRAAPLPSGPWSPNLSYPSAKRSRGTSGRRRAYGPGRFWKGHSVLASTPFLLRGEAERQFPDESQELFVLFLDFGELGPGGRALGASAEPAVDGGLVHAVVFGGLGDGEAFFLDLADSVRFHLRCDAVDFLGHRYIQVRLVLLTEALLDLYVQNIQTGSAAAEAGESIALAVFSPAQLAVPTAVLGLKAVGAIGKITDLLGKLSINTAFAPSTPNGSILSQTHRASDAWIASRTTQVPR